MAALCSLLNSWLFIIQGLSSMLLHLLSGTPLGFSYQSLLFLPFSLSLKFLCLSLMALDSGVDVNLHFHLSLFLFRGTNFFFISFDLRTSKFPTLSSHLFGLWKIELPILGLTFTTSLGLCQGPGVIIKYQCPGSVEKCMALASVVHSAFKKCLIRW